MPQSTEKPVDKSTAKSSKVFDVAKPGKLPTVDATARPVIVTNRTIMRDPMMAGPSDDTPPSAPPIAQTSKIIIKPLDGETDATSDEKPAPAKKASADEAAEAVAVKRITLAPVASGLKIKEEPASAPGIPDATEVAAAADAPSDTVEPSAIQTTEQSKPSPSGLVSVFNTDANETRSQKSVSRDLSAGEAQSEDPAPAAGTQQAKPTVAAEEALKQQEELEALIADETYFLPLDAVERRRSRMSSIAGLILILLLAAVLLNLLLDAGTISLPGIRPLTDFF